jgi:hypothetical protein
MAAFAVFIAVGKNIHFGVGRLFGLADFQSSVFELFHKEPESVFALSGSTEEPPEE